MGPTLLEAVTRHPLSPRARARLLLNALEGLAQLHAARIIHRDFTLRNILVDPTGATAVVFDFDLAIATDDVGATSYRTHYRGRVFGSPGYSVAPETLDPGLMDAPLSGALDVYAAGGALHGLFTDKLPYGDALDMWGLLVRIAEGVVNGGRSAVSYPAAVPQALRPIIDRCLERDPAARYPSIVALAQDLGAALPALSDQGDERVGAAGAPGPVTAVPGQRLAGVFASRPDPAVTRAEIETADQAVWSWGYRITRALGRVKGRNIFMAEARPDLLATGQFPDANTFPKVVTVIDLDKVGNARMAVENWQQHFFPSIKKVRRGLMTGLYNVIHDTATRSLLVLTEYVDDPRFGGQVDAASLPVDGALSLALLVARQVAALHEHGVAHNNIHAGALLFKALHDTCMVQPAMIGLIDPSLLPAAMADDVRALATLLQSWLAPARIAQLPKAAATHVWSLHARLGRWIAGDKGTAADLVTVASDGLAKVDGNFAVLRQAGGDLEQYALLIVSHRLYHKLWKTP
jgi:tRNA A-37 threonylcarbamoyl transferase component Bud32